MRLEAAAHLVPESGLEMRGGLSMSTRAGGLRRGTRGIIDRRLRVVGRRGMMHELRQIRIMPRQGPQNALMQCLRAPAWDRAFNREASQLVAKCKRLIVVAQQPAHHRLISGCAHV